MGQRSEAFASSRLAVSGEGEARTRGASLGELESLYREQLPRFLRLAFAITGDSEQARDAVHEAFVSCVAGRTKFRGQGPVAAWVWRAVVTAALKSGRRRGEAALAARLEPAAVASAETGDAVDSADGEAVRDVVSRLPERQRLVLFLRYYADLDYAAIARVLDMRVGTVGATLNAAHRSMRDQLQEVGFDG
jgi:RNA polymerase sigma-70 factor, ECF subfamily